jgi:hypothetical protein
MKFRSWWERRQSSGLSFKEVIVISVINAFFILLGIALVEWSSYRRTVYAEESENQRLERVINVTQTQEALHTELADVGAPLNQTATVTVTSSPTLTLAPTITPIPTEEIDTTSPQQAVIDYYDNINQGKYLEAWNTLSSNFQLRYNQNDYLAYEGFWKSAGKVSVTEVVLEEMPNEFEATLLVGLYWEADRRTRSNQFFLIRDLVSDAWLIDSVGLVN